MLLLFRVLWELAPVVTYTPSTASALVVCDLEEITVAGAAGALECGLLSQFITAGSPPELPHAVPWFPHWQSRGCAAQKKDPLEAVSRACSADVSRGCRVTGSSWLFYSLHIRVLSTSRELHTCYTCI